MKTIFILLVISLISVVACRQNFNRREDDLDGEDSLDSKDYSLIKRQNDDNYDSISLDGDDPEAPHNCWKQVHMGLQCPEDEFPFVKKAVRMRGRRDWEMFVTGVEVQELCDGLLPYLRCGLNMLESVSDRCETFVQVLRQLSHEQTVDLASKLFNLGEDVCREKVNFLNEHAQCLKNLVLGEYSKRKFYRCESVRRDPCQESEEIISCIKAAILDEEECSEEVAEAAAELLRKIRQAVDSFCASNFRPGNLKF